MESQHAEAESSLGGDRWRGWRREKLEYWWTVLNLYLEMQEGGSGSSGVAEWLDAQEKKQNEAKRRWWAGRSFPFSWAQEVPHDHAAGDVGGDGYDSMIAPIMKKVGGLVKPSWARRPRMMTPHQEKEWRMHCQTNEGANQRMGHIPIDTIVY